MNLELNEIAVWFKANKLTLNEGKAKYTFFHKFRQKDNILLKLPMLAINGKVIERTTSIKFLGILLDEHLSWKNHISVVENKVSNNIGILQKAKNIFSKRCLKTLHFSFVHSFIASYILNYGNIAITRKQNKDRLLKQAIRVIYAAEYTRGKMEEMKVL